MARAKTTGTLTRVSLNRGGYDRQGEYYGAGKPLFRYWPDAEYNAKGRRNCSAEFRADSRAAALKTLRIKCPTARVRGTRKAKR